MNPDIFKKIFENSESKEIDIWCDGKLVAQFQHKPTSVSNEGNGTLSITRTDNGNVFYLDTLHTSGVWVCDDNKKKEDGVFID